MAFELLKFRIENVYSVNLSKQLLLQNVDF